MGIGDSRQLIWTAPPLMRLTPDDRERTYSPLMSTLPAAVRVIDAFPHFSVTSSSPTIRTFFPSTLASAGAVARAITPSTTAADLPTIATTTCDLADCAARS